MKKTRIKLVMSVILLGFAFHSSYGQGARYTGTYTKSSPISYTRKNNIVIDGLEIISNSRIRCIELYDCENVIIKNSRFVSPYHQAIYLYGCKNVTIEDCSFENVNFALKASTSQGVRFDHNDVLNITGYMHIKNPTGDEFGGMAQFITVTGANNSISYNVCENIAGQSDLEDIINTFGMSGGTHDSPLIIKGNWIRGGGTSNSGTGIVIGDYGGKYSIVQDNVLINPGQAGIGIAGGQNMTLKDNIVYSKRMNNTNVGMVVYNWTENRYGAFENVIVKDNRINFTSNHGGLGNWWMPDPNNKISVNSGNIYDKNLNENILPTKIIGRARDNAGSNNNNTGNESETPEVEPDIPSGGGGSTTPDIENNNQGSDTDKDADKDTDDEKDNGTDDEVNKPTSPGNQLTNVTIYLDWFNRICVNSRGRVYRGSTVTVSNAAGDRIHTQSLTGYHTVLRSRFKRGTYIVTVKSGNKSQTKELTIK